jgi:uncharacterized membrane protein
MREQAEKPFFGPESPSLDPPNPPEIMAWRSVAKAISWRTIGSIDTLILSYLLITYVGPHFGLEHSQGEAAKAAGYIAITEVVTKLFIYYFHERGWEKLRWGTSVVNGRHRETHKRSATKTATFRTIASLDTMLLAWIFTDNIGTAMSIGGLEIVSKVVLYFVHERIWSILPFGIVHRVAVSG